MTVKFCPTCGAALPPATESSWQQDWTCSACSLRWRLHEGDYQGGSHDVKSTWDVIEAVRANEPCTEEELRLAVLSMHTTTSLLWRHAAAAVQDGVADVRLHFALKNFVDSVFTAWKVPLEKRVEPWNRPGSLDARQRRRVAFAVAVKAGSILVQAHGSSFVECVDDQHESLKT